MRGTVIALPVNVINSPKFPHSPMFNHSILQGKKLDILKVRLKTFIEVFYYLLEYFKVRHVNSMKERNRMRVYGLYYSRCHTRSLKGFFWP